MARERTTKSGKPKNDQSQMNVKGKAPANQGKVSKKAGAAPQFGRGH